MAGTSAFPILIQLSTGSPIHSNQTKRKTKDTQIGKEVKLIICRSHDTVTENPKDPIKELLELIYEFGKAAGH